MKSRLNGRATLSILFLLSPLLSSTPASAQPTVWAVSSLVRVGNNAAAGTGTQATISAAKGEYESFQIAVQAPSGGLTNVNATVSDLTGPGGATIAKSSFSLFREQYVYVSQSSPDWDGSNQPLGAGWYPDGLIPFTDPESGQPIQGAQIHAVPFDLDTANNQPIWVDLLVPRSAVAGNYAGTYTVTSDQGSITGNISLTVWNFTLPLQASLKSAFLSYGSSSVATDRELLRNRLSPLHTDTSAQSSLMSNFGLNIVGLAYNSGSNFGNCSMSDPPSVSDLEAVAAQQQPGLTKLVYSADEVDQCPSLIPTLKQWGQNLHKAGILNLVTMEPNTALFDDGTGTGRSAVDIWTIMAVGYDQAGSMPAAALAKGDSLWSYNALVQDSYSPKWQIDFAPVNFRIQPGFISQSLGFTGILYWKIDNWSADPWAQVNNAGTYSGSNYPGEGMLVYPGYQVGIDGVAPSMRLKWLRDGVEDYEYVQLLKAAGQGDSALQKVATVGASWSNWSQDPNQVQNVRDQLGRQLDQLNGSGSIMAPVAVTTTPSATPSGGAGCQNTLLVNFVKPSIWTAIQTGAAQTIQAKITDNCGSVLTAANGGTVSAAFTSGDSTVALQDWGNGIWNGTWTPANAATQVTLTVSAAQPGASGSAQVAVNVQSASHVTSVTSVVNSAAGTQATAGVVAPGSYVSIFGTNLGGSASPVASSTPLPTSLNGTQVFLGAKLLPLAYAGPNQINGVIPQGFDTGSTYALVVVSGGYSSTPVPVSIAPIQPAIYTNDGSGSGPGVIAQQGQYLVIYCNGLGPVAGPNGESAPADGAAAPTSVTLSTLGKVTVSIGGTQIPAQFAGLAPSLVNVYQVNVQVPAGVSGDAVPVTITETDPQTGQTVQSNTVTIPLQ